VTPGEHLRSERLPGGRSDPVEGGGDAPAVGEFQAALDHLFALEVRALKSSET
jgi:hypothetical protein